MIGRDEVAAHLGCTRGAVYQAMKGLVHKGWLGEAGGQYSRYYFNDCPEDLED
jgi:DNA-binding GntR family transcriptional regulator